VAKKKKKKADEEPKAVLLDQTEALEEELYEELPDLQEDEELDPSYFN